MLPSAKNRLGLPFIPLHENTLYRTRFQPRVHSHQEPPPLEPHTEETEEKFFSINDIYRSTLVNERSRVTRFNKINEFKLWLQDRRSRKLYAPTIDTLKNEFEQGESLQKFFQIIPFYFEYRFNATYNKPNSFSADLNAIKHLLLTEVGIATNNVLHYPWFKEFKKGVRNINIEVLGKDDVKPKLAIFNPMLEAMIKRAKHSYVKLGMLLAQRFCLRAQHYLKTPSKADFLTLGQIKFRYNNNGSVASMSIYNKRDKNNVSSYEMHRTVYCSCHTDWTCLPCNAHRVVKMRLAYGAKSSEPLIIHKGQHMTYKFMNDSLKAILSELGLDAKNYGTHSLRAGGATEMYLAGYNIIDIRNFAWWKAMESVLSYIRPHNQDMEYFVPDFELYCQSLRKKSVIFGDNDEVVLAMLERKNNTKARYM